MAYPKHITEEGKKIWDGIDKGTLIMIGARTNQLERDGGFQNYNSGEIWWSVLLLTYRNLCLAQEIRPFDFKDVGVLKPALEPTEEKDGSIWSGVAGCFIDIATGLPVDRLCTQRGCSGVPVLDYDSSLPVRSLHRRCPVCDTIQKECRK